MRSVLSDGDKELLEARALAKKEQLEVGEKVAELAPAVVTKEAPAAPEQKTDDYTSQIAKNIPVEVVSFYTGIFALVSANTGNSAVTVVGEVMFVIAFLGTIGYSWLKNTQDAVPNVAIKVAMATTAFVLWAYTIWWPLGTYIPQNSFVGGALILAYLFASPAVYATITEIQKNMVTKPKNPSPPKT